MVARRCPRSLHHDPTGPIYLLMGVALLGADNYMVGVTNRGKRIMLHGLTIGQRVTITGKSLNGWTGIVTGRYDSPFGASVLVKLDKGSEIAVRVRDLR